MGQRTNEELKQIICAKVPEYLSNPTQGRTFGHLMQVCGIERKAKTMEGRLEERVLDRCLQTMREHGIISVGNKHVSWYLGQAPDEQRAEKIEALKKLVASGVGDRKHKELLRRYNLARWDRYTKTFSLTEEAEELRAEEKLTTTKQRTA